MTNINNKKQKSIKPGDLRLAAARRGGTQSFEFLNQHVTTSRKTAPSGFISSLPWYDRQQQLLEKFTHDPPSTSRELLGPHPTKKKQTSAKVATDPPSEPMESLDQISGKKRRTESDEAPDPTGLGTQALFGNFQATKRRSPARNRAESSNEAPIPPAARRELLSSKVSTKKKNTPPFVPTEPPAVTQELVRNVSPDRSQTSSNESDEAYQQGNEDGSEAGSEEQDEEGMPSEEDEEEEASTKVKRKGRGKNLCKSVTDLGVGQKLKIEFYENRGVGKNHTAWSGYLGRIIRDKNICPVRVQSWADVNEEARDHLWASVTEKFTHPSLDAYREETLLHMKELWGKWRSTLHKNYVKTCATMEEAVANVPSKEEINADDWEWLVKEHFSSEVFKKASKRNAENRSKRVADLAPRTGSAPFRELSYTKGGKDGKPPDVATMFFLTRKKGKEIVNKEASDKYDELRDIQRKEPNLSELEVVEKGFGSQRKGKVTCFGGGMKPKHLKLKSKSAREIELERENARLRAEKEEEADYWKKELKEIMAFKEKVLQKMPNIMDDYEDEESEDDDEDVEF